MKIAVLLTVFNRVEKTISCLKSLFSIDTTNTNITFKVFLTNDGSTDGTNEEVKEHFPTKNIEILQGTGQLYWNGGMIKSWEAAIAEGGFEGYLWLNNDTIVYENLWSEIIAADNYAKEKFAKGGIYVGSTHNADKSGLSYGGFNFISKITLKDEFLIPNGEFQNCQAAHGNITFVSHEVVEKEGIFTNKYVHSLGDHDYSYRAYKRDHPVFILRDYVGICENDHQGSAVEFTKLSLKERLRYLKSPLGYNLNNTLLFQKRCFPYRYIPVLIAGYSRALFPKIYYSLYKKIRRKY